MLQNGNFRNKVLIILQIKYKCLCNEVATSTFLVTHKSEYCHMRETLYITIMKVTIYTDHFPPPLWSQYSVSIFSFISVTCNKLHRRLKTRHWQNEDTYIFFCFSKCIQQCFSGFILWNHEFSWILQEKWPNNQQIVAVLIHIYTVNFILLLCYAFYKPRCAILV